MHTPLGGGGINITDLHCPLPPMPWTHTKHTRLHVCVLCVYDGVSVPAHTRKDEKQERDEGSEQKVTHQALTCFCKVSINC